LLILQIELKLGKWNRYIAGLVPQKRWLFRFHNTGNKQVHRKPTNFHKLIIWWLLLSCNSDWGRIITGIIRNTQRERVGWSSRKHTDTQRKREREIVKGWMHHIRSYKTKLKQSQANADRQGMGLWDMDSGGETFFLSRFGFRLELFSLTVSIFSPGINLRQLGLREAVCSGRQA